MADTNGSSSDRMDRIERMMEAVVNTQADNVNTQAAMQQDIKNLYRSQVVMGEVINQLTASLNELAEAQKHTDRNMDGLILTVDEIIRGRKRE